MDMRCYTASSWKLRAPGAPLSLSISLYLSRWTERARSPRLATAGHGWPPVPCETVIGCTPCSRANPGAVGKYFLSRTNRFSATARGGRDRPRGRPPYGNSFEPRPVIDAPAGPLINLSAPIVYPRRLINSDRPLVSPATCLFFSSIFRRNRQPNRALVSRRLSFNGGEGVGGWMVFNLFGRGTELTELRLNFDVCFDYS